MNGLRKVDAGANADADMDIHHSISPPGQALRSINIEPLGNGLKVGLGRVGVQDFDRDGESQTQTKSTRGRGRRK